MIFTVKSGDLRYLDIAVTPGQRGIQLSVCRGSVFENAQPGRTNLPP
jgi:hypothetical protein